MVQWTRQPQERDGDYFFCGQLYVTQGVLDALTENELTYIVSDLQGFVQENNGIDYLQVYTSDDGRKVWCIDQLSKTMKESGDYTPDQVQEYDYWTILLPEEY